MTNPILQKAYHAWTSCSELRSRRERYKRYTYGDQWSDTVSDASGRLSIERDAIVQSGKHPYTNNLIRQLVKTIIGRYRHRSSENKLYDSVSEAAVSNALPEMDARLMEEFLISGCAIQRIVRERRWQGSGVWVDNVDPRRFFVNAFTDPRGWDIELVGMLHDMSVGELVNRFAGGDRRKAERLRRLYDSLGERAFACGDIIGDTGSISDFFSSSSPQKCRVIEVWTFDARPRKGSGVLDFSWHCRMFAPDGSILSEYDSSPTHKSHPFCVKFYPLTDGEVHSFVEDILDQQKFINRLIVSMDHMMACSAKGVLLFPMSQLPKNISLEQVAKTWTQADGVIPITGHGTQLPVQVHTPGSDSGAYQLLELQMKLLEEVSGVSGALSGRSYLSAKGADMLNAQIENATLALSDIFETFDAYCRDRNAKIKLS